MKSDKKSLLSTVFDKKSGNTVIIPLDDSSISGPEDALRHMDEAVKSAVAGGANAILAFSGLFKRYGHLMHGTPGIINITLSTEGPHHLHKVLVGHVERAQQYGMLASVHLNTTAPYEPEMLSMLGLISDTCDKLGVPLLAHVYPRTIVDGTEDHYLSLQAKDPEAYAKMVRHGARIAADLGADIIKVPFTGDTESFRTVVESAYGLPVVMAGGPRVPIPVILQNVHMAMQAGAHGAAVGRNFFKRVKGREMVVALRAIVHDGASVESAMAMAKLLPGD